MRRRPLRIIPVLDLKGGVVVHARRGRRDEYAPLRSPLVRGAEPVPVARALCAACRTRTIYVADLDAIGGAPVDVASLTALAEIAEPWVDAGASAPGPAAALARAGVARNVIGTESLGPEPVGAGSWGTGSWGAEPGGCKSPAAGARVPEPPGAPARVLSVDLRDGRLISPRPDLSGREPTAVARLAAELGVSELLVIDLARVGSGSGPPLAAVRALVAALPGIAVFAGGGVRDDDDLDALAAAGAAGALVATALHAGRISP